MITPFFSIIIPLYNSSKTLPYTLDSIGCQSFKSYELVFIDGGSVDDTQLMVSKFRESGDTITQFISKPDKGIYDAMNKGVDMAKGKWLYFIGGDDTLAAPDTLSTIHQVIQNQQVDLIYGNVTGNVSGTRYTNDTIQEVLSRGIHHQGIFFKRKVFDFAGPYDLNFKVAADYYLTLKVFCNPIFKTQYVDIDIAQFGETGLSSTCYDYRFFGYHYKFLAQLKAIDKIEDRMACISQSIYCCLYLAKKKESLCFAWSNILYYITRPNPLPISQRVKTFLRMLRWTIKSAE